MGAPNTIRRRCVGAGYCWWCGQLRNRVYSYNGDCRQFCGIVCAAAYYDWPLGRRRLYDRIEVE